MKFLGVVLLLTVGILKAQQSAGPGSPAKADPQLDEAVPVDPAPEPTDPVERALRATRNRLQNSPNPLPSAASEGPINSPQFGRRSRLDTRPSGPPAIIYVDRAPAPPNARPEEIQFPVAKSDTVLLGSVTKVQPYLSEDGRNLYTEYTILVEELFKDGVGLSLKTGSVVSLFRKGGALRLGSGRVVRTDVRGLGAPPAANHRYVCFLNYDARGHWFQIVKLWELRNGTAAPMDPVDQGFSSSGKGPNLAGMEEAAFLNSVRDAVQTGARR